MANKATRYEKSKSREHRGEHLGGPGKPDYVRGTKLGEVKNRKTPVTASELKRLAARGVREIDSKGGFTGPALEAAKALGVKLFSRGKNAS